MTISQKSTVSNVFYAILLQYAAEILSGPTLPMNALFFNIGDVT